MVPELFDVFMIFILMLSVAKKGLILSIKKIEITKTIIWSLQNLKREKKRRERTKTLYLVYASQSKIRSVEQIGNLHLQNISIGS
jgi:hypothetical protein